MEPDPKYASYGVPFPRRSGNSRYGQSFGKGEAESSNLSGSTTKSKTYRIFAEFPAGSFEPVHNFRRLLITALLAAFGFAIPATASDLNLPPHETVRAMIRHAAEVQGVPVPGSGPIILVTSRCRMQREHGAPCPIGPLFVYVYALYKNGTIYLDRKQDWRRMGLREQKLLSHEIAHFVGHMAGKRCSESCARKAARTWLWRSAR